MNKFKCVNCGYIGETDNNFFILCPKCLVVTEKHGAELSTMNNGVTGLVYKCPDYDQHQLNDEEKSLIDNGRKIDAIKLLRNRYYNEGRSLGLAEAKAVCDAYDGPSMINIPSYSTKFGGLSG